MSRWTHLHFTPSNRLFSYSHYDDFDQFPVILPVAELSNFESCFKFQNTRNTPLPSFPSIPPADCRPAGLPQPAVSWLLASLQSSLTLAASAAARKQQSSLYACLRDGENEKSRRWSDRYWSGLYQIHSCQDKALFYRLRSKSWGYSGRYNCRKDVDYRPTEDYSHTQSRDLFFIK